MPRTVIGCDLSRAVLDLHSLPVATSSQVANDPEAITTWVSSLEPDVLVVFEATSGCDAPLIAALVEVAPAIAPLPELAARTYRMLMAAWSAAPLPLE